MKWKVRFNEERKRWEVERDGVVLDSSVQREMAEGVARHFNKVDRQRRRLAAS